MKVYINVPSKKQKNAKQTVKNTRRRGINNRKYKEKD
jgi:hypothetical protein